MSTNDFFNDSNNDNAIELGAFAERAYLDYAMSVVKGRALPQVQDGLKPVQRRILYAMHEMGLSANAKAVKSARVVGDVLGKFHPHGDSAAYEALVRMAQNFTLRYPLIDGQGNFGSRDGDGAAAMRYTEARLTPIAALLLDELEQGTTDFVANYDGSFKEPALLPARLPMMLLNGASGIAVGLATEIPPHNLNEIAAAAIALIKNENLSHAALMELVPGPDFANGGQLISDSAEIAAAYESGRGSLRLRAQFALETLARGQWQWVVTELPQGVSCAKVLEEIEELSNPKVKAGKKALSPEQQQLKASINGLLDAVRDESGREASVRIVLEPKTAKVEAQELQRFLLAHTSLECSVSLNMVAIGLDGNPKQMPLKTALLEWVTYRRLTAQRRSQFALNKARDRLHILRGRQLVLLSVDKVIAVIRNSDEPRADLMAQFKLSEIQAEDILEMRLRQLARLEGFKIEREIEELSTKEGELAALLGNPDLLKKLLIKEITQDAKTFGDARRTLIQAEARVKTQVQIIDEPLTVVFTQKAWAKARSGHGLEPLASFKMGDALHTSLECRSTDTLLAFASNGRVYSLAAHALPSGRGDGAPLSSLIELDAGISLIAYFVASDSAVALASSAGLGFTAPLAGLVSSRKQGKQIFDLAAGERVVSACAVLETSLLVCLSSSGKALAFAASECRSLPAGGKGVILMSLEGKESLSGLYAVAKGQALTLSGNYRNKPTVETLSYSQLQAYAGKRAGKGKLLDTKLKAPQLGLL